MQVVLTERVAKLGNAWEVVDVKPGYALNFLFKKNLAVPASKQSLAKAEKIKATAIAKAEAIVANAKEIAEKLKDAVVLFTEKAQGDKLYGSIKAKDIIAQLAEQKKVEVTPAMVKINDGIKTLGEHEVTLQLTDAISTTIKVVVEEAK